MKYKHFKQALLFKVGSEIELLKGLLEEEDSQFVAIYGRRRVGKTFLIREAFNYSFAFQHTGIYGASLKEQLSRVSSSLFLKTSWKHPC